MFSFILFFSISLSGQSKPKKDFSDYYSKAVKFSYNNNDSLIFYAQKMQLSKKQCQRNKGILFEARGIYQKGDYLKSQLLALLVVKELKNHKGICDKKNLIDAYRRLFYIYMNTDKYDDALIYLNKRKEIVETFSVNKRYYQKNIIDIEKSIASLMIKVGLFNEALKTLKNSNKKINEPLWTQSP